SQEPGRDLRCASRQKKRGLSSFLSLHEIGVICPEKKLAATTPELAFRWLDHFDLKLGVDSAFIEPLKHPRGKPLSCRPVFQGNPPEVLFGVAAVALVIPEIDKAIFENPVQELLRRKPDQGRILGNRRGVTLGEL